MGGGGKSGQREMGRAKRKGREKGKEVLGGGRGLEEREEETHIFLKRPWGAAPPTRMPLCTPVPPPSMACNVLLPSWLYIQTTAWPESTQLQAYQKPWLLWLSGWRTSL